MHKFSDIDWVKGILLVISAITLDIAASLMAQSSLRSTAIHAFIAGCLTVGAYITDALKTWDAAVSPERRKQDDERERTQDRENRA